MFIDINEMDTVIQEYKLNEISDTDYTILQRCIIAAVKRVKGYLMSRYDTDKIFTAVGDDRDPDIVEICKNAALWYLVRRNNVDILYDRVKEVYDRDIAYLKEVASGNIPADLPLKENSDGEGTGSIRMGSNTKFRHSW